MFHRRAIQAQALTLQAEGIAVEEVRAPRGEIPRPLTVEALTAAEAAAIKCTTSV